MTAAARTLLLLRHAKSNWDDAALDDFDRPLAGRGREAAPRMGREMARRGWLPEHAIVSPALRTRQTWQLVAAELPDPPQATFDASIYEAAPEAILSAIRRVPDTITTLLVVGHNPGLEDLAALLASPDSDAGAAERLKRKFPTAALARFDVAGEWPHLGAGDARLVDFVSPRELG